MDKLYLEIITPERVMVAQEADMVEAPGTLGEFGVLPGHAALLTTLDIGEIRFMSGGSTRRLATSGGFAEVSDNKVTLLVDTGEFGEEIDVDRARRAKERAEAALKGTPFGQSDYAVLEAALYRAIARISTASKAMG